MADQTTSDCAPHSDGPAQIVEADIPNNSNQPDDSSRDEDSSRHNSSSEPDDSNLPSNQPVDFTQRDESELDAGLDWGYKETWQFYGEDKFEMAEIQANQLLAEPRLQRLHRAGMLFLLAMAPDALERGDHAIRLYKEILEQDELSDAQRLEANKMLEWAEEVRARDRSDHPLWSRDSRSSTAGGSSTRGPRVAQTVEVDRMRDKIRALEIVVAALVEGMKKMDPELLHARWADADSPDGQQS